MPQARSSSWPGTSAASMVERISLSTRGSETRRLACLLTLASVFKVLTASRDETFGNARAARNLFEATVSKQANRLVSLPRVDKEILSTVEAADIPGQEELRACGILNAGAGG